MIYRVRHETLYLYSEPVATSHNEAHLLPRALPRQSLVNLELRCDPTPETVVWHRDYFGNDVVFLAVDEPHERLVIRTECRVDVRASGPIDALRSPAWETVAARVRNDRAPEWLEAFEMVFPSTYVPVSDALAAYARPSFAAGRPLAAGAIDLSHRIHTEFGYDPAATQLATPVEEVLRDRHGVCQDFAHLMIGCLRSLGIPARYVSGYLRSAPSPIEAAKPEEPGDTAFVGAEASHAWVSFFCPANGWVDVDPTNDLVPGEGHIVLAWGRDYEDVSPVKGVTLGGGGHEIRVAVEVRPEPTALADGSFAQS